MRQANKKKRKDKTAATIVLCFCLLALTSIFTIKASIDKVNESAADLPVTQKAPIEKKETSQSQVSTDKEVSAPASKDGKDDDAPASRQISVVDSKDKEEKTEAYLSPVSLETATVQKEYSMDMVIYNKTLDQYMTHPGIDLEAPAGSGVHAIADGTVTRVYQDDAYGTSIEITHSDGLISQYGNLEATTYVEKGDVISQGQQISRVGKSAPYEALDSPHLHLEIRKNQKLCNPADIISFSAD